MRSLASQTAALLLAASAISSVCPQPQDVTGRCIFSLETDRNIYTCTLVDVWLHSPDQSLRISGDHLAGMTDIDVRAFRTGTRATLAHFNGEIMAKFTGLESVDLKGASVNTFGPRAFDSCQNLVDLRIAGGLVSTFPPGMLQNCRNLRSFSVSSTLLSRLPSDLFGSTRSLEALAITSNLLAFLPERLLHDMPNLATVDLRRNLLGRLEASSFGVHPKMTSLSVNSNLIYAIEPGIFARCFPNLQLFEALHNNCTDATVAGNFDDHAELALCFDTWRGITTTTTENGGSRKGVLVWLLGFLWIFLMAL